MSFICLLANPNFLFPGMLFGGDLHLYIVFAIICMMLRFTPDALQGKVYGRLVLMDGCFPALDSHALDHAHYGERCYMRRHGPLSI